MLKIFQKVNGIVINVIRLITIGIEDFDSKNSQSYMTIKFKGYKKNIYI